MSYETLGSRNWTVERVSYVIDCGTMWALVVLVLLPVVDDELGFTAPLEA